MKNVFRVLHRTAGLCPARAGKPSGAGGSKSWIKLLRGGGDGDAELGPLMHQPVPHSQAIHVLCSEYA